MKRVIQQILKEDRQQKFHNYVVKDITSRLSYDSWSDEDGSYFIDVCIMDIDNLKCFLQLTEDQVFSDKHNGYPLMSIRMYGDFKTVYGVGNESAFNIWGDVIDVIRERMREVRKDDIN